MVVLKYPKPEMVILGRRFNSDPWGSIILIENIMKASEIDGFDELLDDAMAQASTQWEMNFIASITERYDQYGDDTLISEAQLETLEKIANK